MIVQENKMFKTKYDLWLESQNEATRVYLRNSTKDYNKLVWAGFWLGSLVSTILVISILKLL